MLNVYFHVEVYLKEIRSHGYSSSEQVAIHLRTVHTTPITEAAVTSLLSETHDYSWRISHVLWFPV